jgi:bacterial/archaeal transporter family protein
MSKAVLSVLAGLGGMFGWGTSDFFANLSSDEIGNFKTFFWSQTAGILFTLLLIPVFGISFNLSLLFFALLLTACLFYSSAYLLFYKGFEVGNVSVVSATINLYAVFTMIFAFLFLGQRLTWLQALAVFLIILGVALVSLNLNDLKEKKVKLLKGVKEALLAALLFGVFWNLSELISERTGWMAATLLVKVGSILFLLLISFLGRKEVGIGKISSKLKFAVFLIGTLEALAVLSVNWGIEHGDGILVAPISSALSIVTILMAIIFLKEKVTKLQGLGIVIAILGIVLTAV